MPLPSPLRMDPTQTTTLRRQFEQEVQRRFNKLKSKILTLVGSEDVFGLNSPIVANSAFSSTQFNAEDPDIRKTIEYLQSKLDPRDVLELETQPHVTVKYGLHDLTPDTVKRLVSQTGAVWARLGRLSLFCSEEQDVLKIDIESEPMKGLNRLLSILPNTNTFPNYHPHMTVAYLLPGAGQKYLDVYWQQFIQGKPLIFTTLHFSTPERVQTALALNYSFQERLTTNTKWKWDASHKQVEKFRQWLAKEVEDIVPEEEGDTPEGWWGKYIQEGYRKGAARAFSSVRKRGWDEKLDFYRGTKEQFLRSSFSQPESINKVKLLAGRVFTDLKGVTEQMASGITRTLIDGLTQGQGPMDIAKAMAKAVDMPISRARMIARTETIRAHAEGALDGMEGLGVKEVGVMVEWSTAGHNVCQLCQALEGIVLKIEEARGMFPRHPNCKCSPIPANVGESTKGQIRGKLAIEEAINQSIEDEIPTGSGRSIKQQKTKSSWPGAKKAIDKTRPKSFV